MEPTKPCPKTIRQIVEQSRKPLVFRGLIDSWPLLDYSFEKWCQVLDNRRLTCRVGQKRADTGVPLWERRCDSVDCTLTQLIEWSRDRVADLRSDVKPSDHFLYFDYKYMKDLFGDDVLRMIDWSTLGFDDRNGMQSTFWLGTEGAHTSCHYDTYGCNLVAQIAGTKKWIMFPPEDSALMKPTRIPYEESSVYSRWDLRQWSDSQVPNIDGTHPHCVVLHPGDVLLVPRHWWHFVINTELSISVNTWLERPEDDQARLEEALVKFFMANVSRNLPSSVVPDLLNPNEEETSSIDLGEIERYIRYSVEALKTGEPMAASTMDVNQLVSRYNRWISPVECCVASSRAKRPKTQIADEENHVFKIIRAFCDPRVVQSVARVLREDCE